MRTVDLNADVGESFGPTRRARCAADSILTPTLPAVPRGRRRRHAGSGRGSRATITWPLERIRPSPTADISDGVRCSHTAGEVEDDRRASESGRSAAIAAAGARLHHVKPHGALYNMAARDERSRRGNRAAQPRLTPRWRSSALPVQHSCRRYRGSDCAPSARRSPIVPTSQDGSLLPRESAGQRDR